MKIVGWLIFAVCSLSWGQTPTLPNVDVSELAKKEFIKSASQIPTGIIRRLPVQHNGRIKPLDTFSREMSLFLTGSRSPLGLDPIQFYLGLITYEGSGALEYIEIRNKDLRKQMGYPKEKRYYSLAELEQAGIEAKARPLAAKDEENRRALSPLEKDTLEAFHQYFLAREIASGENFLGSIDFSILNSDASGHPTSGETSGSVLELGKQFLRAAANRPEMADPAAQELVAASLAQPVPDIFKDYRSKIDLEVRYNHLRPFLFAGILYFCLGLALCSGLLKKIKVRYVLLAYLFPLVFHLGGFFTRVYITGFAPVTNMYTTMLWVAFGVTLFSIPLLVLYKNQALVGLLLLGSSLVLLLTENFPLILSPDMDPIVAVLRSNYWLTIHVLTITISYAAFTICMLIGNYALIRTVIKRMPEDFYKNYAHYAYRMAQLGVCLITAGIILGGIWADYSWGRFWGWDPKETWALIADLGFIVILHARHVGWLRSFGTLAAAPLAYLLVIMAWYGVNFILAAGLHSYGFSSGGATFVAIFVSLQILLSGTAAFKRISY